MRYRSVTPKSLFLCTADGRSSCVRSLLLLSLPLFVSLSLYYLLTLTLTFFLTLTLSPEKLTLTHLRPHGNTFRSKRVTRRLG